MQTFSPITLGKRLTKIETNGFVLTETKHQPNLSLAIKFYKKSLELNPNNTNAVEQIKKLNQEK